MVTQRKDIFNYNFLSPIEKVSLWLSNRMVAPSLREGSWLDILSGYDSLLQISQRKNPKIRSFYALDHKLNKTLIGYNFKLKEAYINKKLPYRNNIFDNVTIINGLEHLWYPQEILSECYRVLKTGGILQIIVPTWLGKPLLEFLAFRIKNKQALVEMNDHKMYYDEKILWSMLVKAGFEPRDIKLKRIKFYCSLYSKAIKVTQNYNEEDAK